MKEIKREAQKTNLIDRVVGYFNPDAGLRRLKARAIIGAWEKSSYNGASKSRAAIGGYHPTDGDANDATVDDLQTLRARSRDIVRNTPVAGGALSTLVTNVIGTGLSMRAAINYAALGLSSAEAGIWQDAINSRFEAWADSVDCDAARALNFYGLQGLAFRSMLESGDVCALPVQLGRPGAEFGLQLIEADRLCNPDDKQDTDRLIAGIEIDGFGAAVKYHFCNQHPSNWKHRNKRKWSNRPAYTTSGLRGVIHLREIRRPGQLRGVPVFAPVIEPLKQLARYTEAELQAAVVSGAFAAFLKMDPNAFSELFDDAGRAEYTKSALGWDGRYPRAEMDGPGRVVNLLPGEDVVESNPGRPNSEFDPFVKSILMQIGCELGLPLEVLVKRFESSYSAARAALLDAWRTFRNRREFMASYFCQPVYEEWLTREIAAGRVSAPGFFEDPFARRAWLGANWIGDGPGSIDPSKEIDAAKKRVDLGVSTIADESILWDGRDWWDKHRQRARERALRVGAGLEDAAQAAPSNG